MIKNRIGLALFHQFAAVDQRHPVAEVAHQGEIVADEEIGQPEPVLHHAE